MRKGLLGAIIEESKPTMFPEELQEKEIDLSCDLQWSTAKENYAPPSNEELLKLAEARFGDIGFPFEQMDFNQLLNIATADEREINIY